ncbi:MAG: alcohol dehydrogenase catalytic domain-containing protein [Nannocystaceae bacterium]
MRALVRGDRGLALEEVATPRALAADEVLLRVLVAGLCRTDRYVAEGRLGGAQGPRILGHEVAAEVVAVGEGAGGIACGARVSVDPRIPCEGCEGCEGGRACESPRFLGVDVDGGFAEYLRVPASAVVSVANAAALDLRALAYVEPIAASLAVFAAGIAPGERGVVVGGGRIAALCLALLRQRGFTAVELWDPAADAGVDPTRRGGAFDFAIENGIDDDGLTRTLAALRRRGLLVVKSRRLAPLSLDPGLLVRKELRVHAAYYGDFAEAAALVADGALDLAPLWGPLRPLDDFAAAFAEASRGEGRKQFFAIAAARAEAETGRCAGSSAPSA